MSAWLAVPPPSPATRPRLLCNSRLNCISWLDRTLVGAFSGVLSFGLLVSSPSAIALEAPSLQTSISPRLTSSEICREVEREGRDDTGPEVVTNEGIVEEAWNIVNDSFLDAGGRRWSQESWQVTRCPSQFGSLSNLSHRGHDAVFFTGSHPFYCTMSAEVDEGPISTQKRKDILSNSIQTRSKAHQIIKRMLASLGDPYTRFLSPEEFSKMARYDMTGIGINLREVPDENGIVRMKVLGIILDGPAHSAGVRQGDEILTVNGVEVQGKSAFEVSSLLQGPNETFVTIQVKHGNCGPIESIEVQRQLVARTPVFYRLEQADNDAAPAGYIRLKEFNALARKDLIIAMKRLQDMGASYFILDLRDNLGGLVQAGIEIAKLFLGEGDTVIYTVGRDSQFQKAIVANASPLVQAPVIVLVNDKTASASEIVASALHDNCRAVLVGQRTYGKGLIQSVFELHDGSGVVVTVGKYVTPNHKDINGNGIEPDFQKLPALDDVSKRLSNCTMLQQG